MKRAKVFFVAVSSVLLLASSAVAAPEGGMMKAAKAKAEEARDRNKTFSFSSAQGIAPTATGGRLLERYTVNSAGHSDIDLVELRDTVVTFINNSRNAEDVEVVFYDGAGNEVCRATLPPEMPPGYRAAVTTGFMTFPVMAPDAMFLFYAEDTDGFPCPPFEGYAKLNATTSRLQIDAFRTYYANYVTEMISATPVRVQKKNTPTKGD